MKILVTAAGSSGGIALIRAFKDRGHYVGAADPQPFAPGKAFADKSLTIPWASDELELARWFRKQACAGWDLVVVANTAEIWAAEDAGLPMFATKAIDVERCEDKMDFARTMAMNGISHPPTTTLAPEHDGDWILKPRWGEGSKHTFQVTSAATAAALMDEFYEDHLILQPRLTGIEWEADVICDRGIVLGGVSFFKHRMYGGTTVAAETFELDRVMDELEAVAWACELNGPANIGGFLDADSTTILEVNPRWSHGFQIAEAAGADMIEFFTRFAQGDYPGLTMLYARPGVRFDRYWGNVVRTA